VGKKAFAWSFSALTRYENCPKQYYHLSVAKDFKDTDSSYAADGKVIHDGMHARVIKGTPLPLPIRYLEPLAAPFALAKGEKHGEMQLALNAKFEPVAWFADDTWVRAIVDLLIIQKKPDRHEAIIVDWKTGKVKDDFTQLRLTAAILSRYMPEVDFFTMVYVWTQSKQITKRTATLSMLTQTWNELLPRVSKIKSAIRETTFPARPSGLCRFCPVRTCPHQEDR
jgi:hypothetical protein